MLAVFGFGVGFVAREIAGLHEPRPVPAGHGGIDVTEQTYLSALATASVNRKEQALQRLLAQLRTTNSSSVYNFGIYQIYRGVLDQYDRPVANVRMLEIGPGVNLSAGVIFVMSGAAKYYGLDIYRHPDVVAAAQYETVASLYRLVAPQQIRRPVEEFMKVRDGQVEFDRDRIEHLYPRQSYDIPLSAGSLDYVFSHATMEHVADPMRTVEAIHRVLASGAVTVHQIDLRDHDDFSRPLEFLKVDAAAWANKHRNPARAHLYLNRWRASDFTAAFEKAGFRILQARATETYPVTEEMRRSLDAEFRKHTLDDLSVVGLFIVARKP